MKTQLQHQSSNSELELFIQMAALPLAFLGFLLALSFSFSHYFEANHQGQSPTLAYQNSSIKPTNQSPLPNH
ncbi:hypothetical protein [Pantanalinema sp. GBBB05]|uniref:hypothetical protein n=1 Tax=Pantanalinema sp. GBBB05 TaxID=2604139 RepID=UPI001E0143E5|nr:hypothetical protein [Pantanalinema sp. GBBB05]